MHKKLLGLLPLVGLAVLAHHLSHSGRPPSMANQSTSYAGGDPRVYPPYGVFDKERPQAIPVYVSLSGRSIASVTIDGSATHLSHPPHGRQVEYTYIPHTTSFQSSMVLLTPQSLERLPIGMQRLRFTMTDHSFVDYNLVVSADRQYPTRVADGRPATTL